MFVDAAPFTGPNYYRLRQDDWDGKTAYSGIVVVEVSPVATRLTVYPNPVSGNYLYLKWEAPAGTRANWWLYTPEGNRLSYGSVEAEAEAGIVRIPVGDLKPGMYLLMAQSGNRKFVKKVVVP